MDEAVDKMPYRKYDLKYDVCALSFLIKKNLVDPMSINCCHF